LSFNPNKLRVSYGESCELKSDFLPRKYTLTHSDSTGDLFLKIDCQFDKKQISSLYTRLMRDEVLAEWIENDKNKELHIFLHVSGGIVFGWAGMRDKIFRHHLPMVLKALIYGDAQLFEEFPELLLSPILVHFQSNQSKYHRIKQYGIIKDYQIKKGI
jgi:hypothetical protein